MSFLVLAGGTSTDIAVPASGSIAVACQGTALVYRRIGFPNYPDTVQLIGTVVNGQTVFGPYTSGATIFIQAVGEVDTYYEVGTSPVVQQGRLSWQVQPTPNVLNATGAVTGAMILGGLLTSTTAAAVTGTVPTGAVLDATSSFAINESVDWSVINTGATNAFTVAAAASGHTVVGNMTVALSSTGRFRTVKTAAATFVTYRLS